MNFCLDLILLENIFEIKNFITKYLYERVVGNVLNNIHPSTIFPCMVFPAKFHQNCQATFGRCGHYNGSSMIALRAPKYYENLANSFVIFYAKGTFEWLF